MAVCCWVRASVRVWRGCRDMKVVLGGFIMVMAVLTEEAWDCCWDWAARALDCCIAAWALALFCAMLSLIAWSKKAR